MMLDPNDTVVGRFYELHPAWSLYMAQHQQARLEAYSKIKLYSFQEELLTNPRPLSSEETHAGE